MTGRSNRIVATFTPEHHPAHQALPPFLWDVSVGAGDEDGDLLGRLGLS
jgi:hypothetical protein